MSLHPKDHQKEATEPLAANDAWAEQIKARKIGEMKEGRDVQEKGELKSIKRVN